MVVNTRRARLIAFYLPQYHPIPENNQWWGPGFTEWISVAGAKPLFSGHKQPQLPGELGFYDLRLPETREAQADLARAHGIEGFCYWHYWLGNGKRLLEYPFEEVLRLKKPRFPFCLGWANHSWQGVFFGAKGDTLIEQRYGKRDEWAAHFKVLEKAFHDDRYMCVDGKRIFFIFNPRTIPNCAGFLDYLREKTKKSGAEGIFAVGGNIPLSEKDLFGLDAVSQYMHRTLEQAEGESSEVEGLNVYSYERALNHFVFDDVYPVNEFPAIITNWDTTPRLGKNAYVLRNRTPRLFKKHVRDVLSKVAHKPFERNIVFVKSWNEWAEGNYIEPDWEHGRSYLQALAEEVYENF